MKYALEICAGSIHSALAGRDGGASRIELCDNLGEGGTTPSYGMIKTCLSLVDIPVFPIIRPRGGDFVYSDAEYEVMKQDVLACSNLGCEGVVFGILRRNGSVDLERCSELIKLAGGIQLTFHRAFDRCSDLRKGLEDLVSLGFHRILTSGGKDYAEDATAELTQLVKQANHRILIMPGSGITGRNLLTIADETGATEFHSTAKKRVDKGSWNGLHNSLENPYLYETDIEEVRILRDILISVARK